MDGFLLYHFKCFVVIVYSDLSAIYICVKFSNLKKTDRHLFTVGVPGFDVCGVLEVKAIGLPFWRGPLPRPYSLASVCITVGSVGSKYAKVVLSNVLHIHCFESVKSCICGWVSVQVRFVFSEECGLGS